MYIQLYIYTSFSCILIVPVDGDRDVTATPSFQQLDPAERMSYTMQALKRNHCYRLSRFIRLCDYLMNNMLHDLVLGSVKTILTTLEGFLKEGIVIEEIAQPIKEDEDEDESVPLLPLKTPSSSIQNTPSVSN